MTSLSGWAHLAITCKAAEQPKRADREPSRFAVRWYRNDTPDLGHKPNADGLYRRYRQQGGFISSGVVKAVGKRVIESDRAFVAETLKLDCTLSDLVNQAVL